jgi:hypothetical protein
VTTKNMMCPCAGSGVMPDISSDAVDSVTEQRS